jgi:tetratricopeptide (TPR) repeat protein
MSLQRARYWVATAYAALNRGAVMDAAKAADRARDAAPQHPDVVLLVAHLLSMSPLKADEGLRALDRADKLFRDRRAPVPAQLFISRGMVFLNLFRFDDAIECFLEANRLEPNRPEALVGLGTAEWGRGNPDAAGRWFRTAAYRYPASTAVRWGRAMWRLGTGQWPEGWADYEMRLASPDWIARWGKTLEAPQWGGQPVPGQTILAYHEQGQGDSLMFSRYLPWLQQVSQCDRLYVRAPAALAALLKHGVDWAGEHTPPTPPDWTISLHSLPYYHGTTLATVPPPLELAA